MAADTPRSFAADFRRHFLSGLFVLIPIAFTAWVLHAIFKWLSNLGQPIVTSLISSMSVTPGRVADPERIARIQRMLEVFKDVLSVLCVIVLIYLLGWATNKVIGRKALGVFDNVMNRIPVAKGIYGTLKQLLATFQQKPEGVQRVVLVVFPHPPMRSVGLVSRTFEDANTGKEMAAVYIPMAPWMTSGHLEIIPVDELFNTNWTLDEAMKFIASGGSVGPNTLTTDHKPIAPSVAPSIERPATSSQR